MLGSLIGSSLFAVLCSVLSFLWGTDVDTDVRCPLIPRHERENNVLRRQLYKELPPVLSSPLAHSEQDVYITTSHFFVEWR